MTYPTAISNGFRFETAPVAMPALAVTTASAPPARGDPPITEGAAGGTGTGGVVEPLGGITDAPPPEVPNTDGSWTATVGGTEFAGLTQADVGRVLWRGERVNVTYEDAEGMVQTASVCEDFPEVEMAGVHESDRRLRISSSVRLDFARCTIEFAGINEGLQQIPYEASAVLPGTHEFLESQSGPTARPISWVGMRDRLSSPIVLGTPSDPVRMSYAKHMLVADHDLRPFLTEVWVRHYYRTASLTPIDIHFGCDSNSPGTYLGLEWFEDDCEANQTPPGSYQVRSDVFGEFHGEATSGSSFSGETEHSLYAEVRGGSTYHSRTCVANPSSIADVLGTLHITGTPWHLTSSVLVLCQYQHWLRPEIY